MVGENWFGEAVLECAACRRPLDGDVDDDPTGDAGRPLDGDVDDDPTGDAGRPLCGECARERDFFVMDAADGELDGTFDG